MQLQTNCVMAAMLLVHCVAAQDYSIKIVPGGLTASAASFLHFDTFTFNDAHVWKNLNGGGARMQNFPPHYLPGKSSLTTPHDYLLLAGATVSYHCAAGNGPCEVAVFVYDCAPCHTKKGQLVLYLAVQGYSHTRCAPTFTTGKVGGIQHRMSAYVKTIAEGSDEVITLPSDVEFVAFALSNGGKPECHSFGSEAACADGTDERCVWKAALSPKCRLATCVYQGTGSVGCNTDTCVKTELV